MARQDENGSDEAGRVAGYGMGNSAACAAGASGVVVSGDDVATVVVVVVGTYGIDIGRCRVGQQLTGQRLAAAAAAAAAAAVVVGCGCQGDRDPACIAGDCSSTSRYDP